MKHHARTVLAGRGSLAALAAVVAISSSCSSGNPAQPSSAVSIPAPVPVSPSDGGTVGYILQPVKLVVANSTSTATVRPTYTFEVASDAAFAVKVQTKTGIVEGTNGQTTAALDTLAASTKYFWRARADSGTSAGVFGPILQFSVGAAVSLSAPAPLSPANGSAILQSPTLTVANATRTGVAGTVTYTFEVSDSTAFSTLAATGTVGEGGMQTSYTVAPPLALGKTYYWHAIATDSANGVSSLPSAVQSFNTILSEAALIASQEGQQLWNATQPPGTPGHTTLGSGWGVRTKVPFGGGTPYVSPQLEALRLIDLVDRGMSPGDAIVWMKQNNYPTIAVYYSGVEVFGIYDQYLADIDPVTQRPSTNGVWNLVDRAE
jgi:hypothetical protein